MTGECEPRVAMAALMMAAVRYVQVLYRGPKALNVLEFDCFIRVPLNILAVMHLIVSFECP